MTHKNARPTNTPKPRQARSGEELSPTGLATVKLDIRGDSPALLTSGEPVRERPLARNTRPAESGSEIEGATDARPRRVPRSECVAAGPDPRTRHLVNRRDALRLFDRFRLLRSFDLAAALFPEREFKTAMSAAQRLLKKLQDERMVTRYRSTSGQTYYGLAEAGARWLRDHPTWEPDLRATASVRRVVELTNPEHTLWANFAVIASKARGMEALNESELQQRLKWTRTDKPCPLTVLVNRGKRQVRKGLMPDALAFGRDGVTWYEIDRSARGSGRKEDLRRLAEQVGTAVTRLGALTGNSTLKRVVLLCRSETILRINRTVLLQLRHGEGGFTDVHRVEEVTSGMLLVHRVREVQLGNGMLQLVREVAGEIVLELLPTDLPGFRYGDPTPTGWFSPTRMPFSRPDFAATRWPVPRRPPSASSDDQ